MQVGSETLLQLNGAVHEEEDGIALLCSVSCVMVPRLTQNSRLLDVMEPGGFG